MDVSVIELWQSTGPLARGVVLLLGGMSVVATAIGLEKWHRVRRAERDADAFVDSWRREGASLAAIAVVRARSPESPVAALADGVLAASAGGALDVHDRVVRRSLLTTGSELRRGLSTIATIGSTAPFVGLFGTVVGIVNAFRELGMRSAGGITTISTGIAEALVTTALGIMVAIPAVWIFNALSQRISRVLVAVEAFGEEIAIATTAGRRASGADRVP